VSPCPACEGEKHDRQYLCRGCWWELPPAARRALNRRDNLAVRRLASLREQLNNGVPLAEISIPVYGPEVDRG